MPQVPRYNQPQVEERAAPSIRLNDNAPAGIFGGGPGTADVTRAAQGLLKTGIDIYDAEKQKADEIAAQDIDLAAAAEESRLENEAKNMRGINALGATDFVTAKWSDAAENIKKMARNDVQRAVADKVIKARFGRLSQSVNSHMSSEVNKYDDSQYENAKKVYREDASLHYADPERVAQSMIDQDMATDAYARRRGIPKEQADAIKFDDRSATHVGVLQRMIFDAKDDAAMAIPRAYEEAHKKEMTADDLGLVARAKQQGEQNMAARRQELTRGAYLLVSNALRDGIPREDITRSINKFFENNKEVPLELRNTLVKFAMDEFDGPEIPWTQKRDATLSFIDRFRALQGVEFDGNGKLISGPKGNSQEVRDKFMADLVKESPKLDREFAGDMYEWIKKDPGAEPKNQFLGRLLDTLNSLPNISPALVVNIATRGFKIMDPKVTIQQANEVTQKLQQEATIAGNPEITRFPVGYRKKTKNGKYLEVTGHDDNGNATWNWAK